MQVILRRVLAREAIVFLRIGDSMLELMEMALLRACGCLSHFECIISG
jgi:hypothetical protein